jgi:myosin-5
MKAHSGSRGFEETTAALSLLGFSQWELSDTFKVLAVILHLRIVTITEAVAEEDGGVDSESSAIPANDGHLLILAELVQLDANEMRSWLCHRKIVSTHEVFFKPMTVEEAVGARDALAKHIYAQLFNWIATFVNKALESTGTSQQFIGVLDIRV